MPRRPLKSTLAACLVLMLAGDAVAQESPLPSVSVQAPASRDDVILPKDTAVAMILLETVSSATATRGQAVQLAVAKDVAVGGRVVIPRGTKGIGVITSVKKGKYGSRDGYLEVKAVALTLVDGTNVKLKKYPTGEDDCGDMGPCWAFILFVVVISPLVIAALPVVAVAALFHRDRDVGKTTYQQAKPEGNDMTLVACTPLNMDSYVARPAAVRAFDPTAPAPISGISACPNLALPK